MNYSVTFSSVHQIAATLILVGLVTLGFRVLYGGRIRSASQLWRFAWFFAFLTAVCKFVIGPEFWLAACETLFALLFPLFTFAGARAFAGRPAPRGLLRAGIACGIGLACVHIAGRPVLAAELSALLGLACVCGAALAVSRRSTGPPESVAHALLPYALLGLALVELIDPVRFLGAEASRWMIGAWVLAAPCVVLTQISALDARARIVLERERARREQAERRLRESEQRYHDHYEKSPAMFATLEGKTGRIIECNRRLSETLGYRRNQLVGMTLADLCHPSGRDQLRRLTTEFNETGQIKTAGLSLKRRDGSRIDGAVKVAGQRGPDGRLVFARVALHDLRGLSLVADTESGAARNAETGLDRAPVVRLASRSPSTGRRSRSPSASR